MQRRRESTAVAATPADEKVNVIGTPERATLLLSQETPFFSKPDSRQALLNTSKKEEERQSSHAQKPLGELKRS